MAELKIERKENLTRSEASELLALLAQALKRGERVDLPLGPSTVATVHVPDNVEVEIEIEVDGDDVEIELELKWSRARSSKPRTRAAAAKTSPAKKSARRPAAKRRSTTS